MGVFPAALGIVGGVVHIKFMRHAALNVSVSSLGTLMLRVTFRIYAGLVFLV